MKPISSIVKARPALPWVQARQATSVSLFRPSSLPIYSIFSPKPSPIASSSKVTLDGFPNYAPAKSHDPVVASLQYATDGELYHALLVPPEASIEELRPDLRKFAQRAQSSLSEWSTSVDPSYAFLELRERPTYRQLLDHIGPCLERIYEALLPSKMHELLASDIYLHHRDPRLLRRLLEVVARFSGHSLRTSMIISMYAVTKAQPTFWAAPRLSDRGLRLVISALVKEMENTDLLQMAWEDLFVMSRWEDPPWELYCIPLDLFESGYMDMALDLANRLHAERYTRSSPRTPIAGDASDQHLALLSTNLDAAIRLQYHGAAQNLAAKLVDLYPSEIHSTAKLVYRVCHGALLGRERSRVRWARKMIEKILALPDPPCPPTAILDSYLKTTTLQESLAYYTKLPPNHYRLTPQQILRLAEAHPSDKEVFALVREIDRLTPEDFASARSTFIFRLAKRGNRDVLRQLYEHWSEGLEVTAPLMMRLLVRFLGKTGDRPFCQRVLETFKAQNPASTATSVALAAAHNMCRQGSLAREYLESIPKDDKTVQGHIADLVQYRRDTAYGTWYQAQRAGLDVGSPIQTILDACCRGKWRGSDRLQRLSTGDDKKVLAILELVQKGKHTRGITLLEKDVKGRDHHVDLYRAVTYSTIGASKYELAIRSVQAVPNYLMYHGLPLQTILGTTVIRHMAVIGRELSKDHDTLNSALRTACSSDRWTVLKERMLDESSGITGKDHDELKAMIIKLDKMVARAIHIVARKGNVRHEDELQGEMGEREEALAEEVSRARAKEIKGDHGSSSEKIVYGNVVQDMPPSWM